MKPAPSPVLWTDLWLIALNCSERYFFSALGLDVTEAASWGANILLTSSAGLPSRAGEGSSHPTACSVPQVCQVLDLPGPSDGAGGEPGCSALV